MMPRALYIQNGDMDGPGLLAPVLEECGMGLEIVHAWDGQPVPTVPSGWCAVVIGGGSMSAFQLAEFPFLQPQMQLISAARAAGTPVLGFCLGAQLMAQAFGARVYKNAEKEIGFYEIHFGPEAILDPLWSGYTAPFQPVHWHGDTFELPQGGTLLASSAITPNQLFRVDGLHYGFQFHLEIDLPSLTEMIGSDHEGSLERNGVDSAAFLKRGQEVLPSVEPIGRAVFARWAKGVLSGDLASAKPGAAPTD